MKIQTYPDSSDSVFLPAVCCSIVLFLSFKLISKFNFIMYLCGKLQRYSNNLPNEFPVFLAKDHKNKQFFSVIRLFLFIRTFIAHKSQNYNQKAAKSLKNRT